MPDPKRAEVATPNPSSPHPTSPPEPSPPPLARASESGDPTVHRLLSVYEAHRLVVVDESYPESARQRARAGMADVAAELAELGFQ